MPIANFSYLPVVVQFFGLTVTDLPAYVVQDGKGKKYISKNMKDGQLAPWLDEYLVSFL